MELNEPNPGDVIEQLFLCGYSHGKSLSFSSQCSSFVGFGIFVGLGGLGS
jgi:hypothetical protein